MPASVHPPKAIVGRYPAHVGPFIVDITNRSLFGATLSSALARKVSNAAFRGAVRAWLPQSRMTLMTLMTRMIRALRRLPGVSVPPG
ncbi:hypothetical protein GCM10010104_27010 [Streptomyces indiaensis]|uniref:Uncharacterized protein n=1 Tax=Streptomyces indiaensis TaxID=284033 RepID=A0ABN3DHY6_9ACTN